MTSPAPDWTKVEENVVRTILDQAEKHLQAQLEAGIAADQRATTVATILIGVMTAILAASGTVFERNLPLAVGGFVTSTMMCVGMFLVMLSARPVDFYLPGSRPSNWWHVADSDLKVLLGGEAENYEEMIVENVNTTNINAKLLKFGLLTAVIAPFLGLTAWAIWVSLFSQDAAWLVSYSVPV